VVVKAYPVADNAAGVLDGLEAMPMRTLLFQRADHAFDHPVPLRAVRGDELLAQSIAPQVIPPFLAAVDSDGQCNTLFEFDRWRCAMVSIYGVMTAERKSRIWELWRKGTPMSSIARDIAKPPATVFSYLLYHGGISPRPRTRRAECLSAQERESISRGLASGASYRAIGRELGRSASTISREVGRKGGPEKYRAYDAEK